MNEKISAWMDGELDEEMADVVLKQVLQNESHLTTCRLYQLIGDSLRDEPEIKSDFMHRFESQLELEPTVLAPSRKKDKFYSSWFGSGAMSTAASVAALSMVGYLAYQTGAGPSNELVLQNGTTLAQQQPVQAMQDYLLVHQQMTGNLGTNDGVVLTTVPLNETKQKEIRK